jgi:hypothetical protein
MFWTYLQPIIWRYTDGYDNWYLLFFSDELQLFCRTTDNKIKKTINTSYYIHTVYLLMTCICTGVLRNIYMYIGFKMFFYVVRHLDSIASYLLTGLN